MDLINYKILGILFLELRKENGLTRQEAVKKINNELKDKVFSLSTLQRIESGIPIKNNKKYCALSKIYGVSYERLRMPYVMVNSYVKEVANSINLVTIEEYELLKKKIEHFYNLHKKSIYISEISKLCITVINAYLYNEKPINRKISHLLDNSDILDGETKILVDYLLYRCSFVYRNYSGFKEKFSKGECLKDKNIFYLCILCYDAKNLNKLQMYKKYNNLLADNKNHDKPVYIFALLVSLSYVEMLLGDYVESYKHLKKAMNIKMIEKYLPKIYLNLTLSFFGFLAYKNDNYKEASIYFLKLRKIDKEALGENYITLFDLLLKEGKKEEVIKIINEDEQSVTNNLVLKVFEYYKERTGSNRLEKLEKIICESIIRSKFSLDIHFDIFMNELKNIVSKTKHYKLYFLYNDVDNIEENYILTFQLNVN